jgi:predicted ATPase
MRSNRIGITKFLKPYSKYETKKAIAVLENLQAIRVSNFRSIVEPLEIPLSKKITFLIGQNNSGKTGILRFLGILFNGETVAAEDVCSFFDTPYKVDYVFFEK